MPRVFLALLVMFATFLGCTHMGAESNPPKFISESDHRDNLARQVAMTPQTIGQLRTHGVSHDTSLALEYFFYANCDANADRLRLALIGLGYSSEHGPSASDDQTLPMRSLSRHRSLRCAVGQELSRKSPNISSRIFLRSRLLRFGRL